MIQEFGKKLAVALTLTMPAVGVVSCNAPQPRRETAIDDIDTLDRASDRHYVHSIFQNFARRHGERFEGKLVSVDICGRDGVRRFELIGIAAGQLRAMTNGEVLTREDGKSGRRNADVDMTFDLDTGTLEVRDHTEGTKESHYYD